MSWIAQLFPFEPHLTLDLYILPLEQEFKGLPGLSSRFLTTKVVDLAGPELNHLPSPVNPRVAGKAWEMRRPNTGPDRGLRGTGTSHHPAWYCQPHLQRRGNGCGSEMPLDQRSKPSCGLMIFCG